MNHLLLQGDARRIPLADQSVHCVVTSPPYFGLRDYGVGGQIGLEATPDAFVASMVGVFREVWRVLRNDGTLWLNLGDSYQSGKGMSGGAKKFAEGTHSIDRKNPARRFGERPNDRPIAGLKSKDLIGIPWRVALALQADGWYLRSDIIWSKRNPMTESVSDRPSKSHEYIFLLTKNRRYFYDIDAIREPHEMKPQRRPAGRPVDATPRLSQAKQAWSTATRDDVGFDGHPLGRNKRTVWTVSTRSFKEAHFATFPPKLIEPCVKAGTSAKGCCSACGANWKRIIEKTRTATRPGRDSKIHPHDGDASVVGNRDPLRHVTTAVMVGWEAGCQCDAGDPVPCTVLDPFNGAATTGVVALAEGRRYIGVDLNPEYLVISQRRLQRPHAPTAKRPTKPKSDRTRSLFGAFS